LILSVKPEPASLDQPGFGALYFAAAELTRKIEHELKLAGPRGPRRDLLVRSTLAARRLSRALRPLAGID
jgi:hypothetical protein